MSMVQDDRKKTLGRMADASFCSTATAATTNTNTSSSRLQCVAFDLDPEIIVVPALSELTLEERQATWYSPEEKNVMIEQAMSIANDFCHGIFYGFSSSEDEGESARGLEFYSVEGSRRRKLNRIKATIAVLKEQQRQQEQEDATKGDELIEAACLAATRECQEQAYIQGCLDEEEVFPQKPRITTRLDAPKGRGMFSCLTQLVRDITDIGYVEWAAQ